MAMCDKFENWAHMSDANKLDALQDAMAHMAEDYDLPMPEVVNGVPDYPETPEDDSLKAGAYDKESNTIYINDHLLHTGTAEEAMYELGHEFAHEMFKEAYATPDTKPGESEAYADQYAQELADEIADYCKPKPPQSPGGDDEDDDDWDLPPEGHAYA